MLPPTARPAEPSTDNQVNSLFLPVSRCSDLMSAWLGIACVAIAVVLTLTGAYFAPFPSVLIGVNPCLNAQASTVPGFETTTVYCSLPAGTGLSQQVVVKQGTYFSHQVPLVSYSYPNLTSITGWCACACTACIESLCLSSHLTRFLALIAARRMQRPTLPTALAAGERARAISCWLSD